MPELPEVEALAQFLAERAVGRVVARVDVVALNVLKTFDPPPTALQGLAVTGVSRHGKVVDLDVDGLHLLVHFSRAGWAQWRDPAPAAPARPGKGPLALRVLLDDGASVAALDLTEAGTQKRLAVHVVHDPADVPYVAALGPDPLALDASGWGEVLAGTRQRLKSVLTDQKVVAGIGNAYSDDIMHAARLSPFAPAGGLDEARLERLAEATALVLAPRCSRPSGARPSSSKTPSGPGCGCTGAPVSRATSAARPSPRCRTRTRRSSTARPARPGASRSRTAGCRGCSSSRPARPGARRSPVPATVPDVRHGAGQTVPRKGASSAPVASNRADLAAVGQGEDGRHVDRGAVGREHGAGHLDHGVAAELLRAHRVRRDRGERVPGAQGGPQVGAGLLGLRVGARRRARGPVAHQRDRRLLRALGAGDEDEVGPGGVGRQPPGPRAAGRA